MNPMVDWQTAYLQQLQRTTGRVGSITQHGSWFKLDSGNPAHIATNYRKSQIIAMTERLKERPDWHRRHR